MLKTFSEYENKQKYTRGQTKERLQNKQKKITPSSTPFYDRYNMYIL